MNLSILASIKEPSGCLVVVNHDRANALNSLWLSHINFLLLVLTLPGISLTLAKKKKQQKKQLKVIIPHFQQHEYIFCHILCVIVTMTAVFSQTAGFPSTYTSCVWAPAYPNFNSSLMINLLLIEVVAFWFQYFLKVCLRVPLKRKVQRFSKSFKLICKHASFPFFLAAPANTALRGIPSK